MRNKFLKNWQTNLKNLRLKLNQINDLINTKDKVDDNK